MEAKPGDLEGLTNASTEALKTEDKPVPVPTMSASAPVDDAPDPDEDDLDDLDDMLDEFSPTKADTKEAAPSTSGPGRPAAPLPQDALGQEGLTDELFARQLQDSMADLLGELETSPEMQAQFENLLKDFGGTAALGEETEVGLSSTASKSKSVAGTAVPSGVAEESFQETIKKTMERMQASGQQATAAAAADDSNDIMAELMKQMQGSGLDGEGSEEDFSKMLLGMMEQLTNKDILYEPMKELDDKYPEWMEQNKSKTSKDDLARYEEQRVVVHEIVAKFEEKTYADSNVADREYIVDRMQKMQAAGAPPPDLVGEMASAQEAFGAADDSCPQQ